MTDVSWHQDDIGDLPRARWPVRVSLRARTKCLRLVFTSPYKYRERSHPSSTGNRPCRSIGFCRQRTPMDWVGIATNAFWRNGNSMTSVNYGNHFQAYAEFGPLAFGSVPSCWLAIAVGPPDFPTFAESLTVGEMDKI